MSSHISLTSGLICYGLGGYAFAKTKSTPSLIGSSVLGSIYLTSFYLNRYTTDKQIHGHAIGLLGGFMATTIGISRYMKSKQLKLVPMGVLLILGNINIIYHAYKLNQWINQ
jgi:uncharacterized membrane protein (UPF0136 family)